MKSATAYIAATALALCTGAVSAQPASPAAAATDPVPRDAAGYVMKAGASDLYEIQSSQLAQQKSQSSGIREVAAMFIEHHTMTTQQVTAAAQAAGLNPPPPALEPKQQAMIDELRGLDGAAFDAAFVRQQRMAHDEALALHSGYAKDGDRPELRAVAKKAVPIIRRHIERLRTLRTS